MGALDKQSCCITTLIHYCLLIQSNRGFMTRTQKTLAAAALAASTLATGASASDADSTETQEQVSLRLQALDAKLFNAAFVE